MIKNVRDLLPGDLVVPKYQSTQAHNADTDPQEVVTVTITAGGVIIAYADGQTDGYTHDDEVEVAVPLPTDPLRLRWRGSVQKWVIPLTSSAPVPAVVVEINGRTAFDGTPKPINGTPTSAS